jgi:hypothetical protein
LCGTVAVAFVQLRRLLRWRAALMHADAATPWLESQVRELAALVGVRPPRLAIVSGLPSPVIWGGGRACLLWPRGLEEQLSPQGCRLVLIHELAHLARGDHWAGWLVLLAGCVWWWHPLFYLIRHQLQRQAELACDARVIALMPEGRRAYAEALLDVCQRQSQRAAATPLVGIAGRRRDLERRLVMIMRANVPGRLNPRLLAGIALLGLIVLPTWTIGQVNTTRKHKPAASESDKQLQALEEKLKAIAKELQAQRKTEPKPEKINLNVTPTELQKEAVYLLDFVDAGTVGASDRDKKLQELETKVQALLKEVQALRGNKTAAQALQGALFADVDMDGNIDIFVTNDVQPKPAEVTLNRTTYKLPAPKAEALGKFLEQHVKAIVMEVKVEGENLVVTTTPEAQRGVGQFIALIEGKKPQGPMNYRNQLRLDRSPQKK